MWPLLPLAALAFTPPLMTRARTPCRARVAMQFDEDELRGKIEAMRVKQIKEELERLGVRHDDAFEKEDLVQRLLDAQQADDAPQAPPTMDQTMAATEMFMADADGPKVMAELEKNPRLMKAAMDIAANGYSEKYTGDAEVMEFMRRLEAISKRGMGE